MNAPSKIEKTKDAPDNLRIWNALGKTDPAHTSSFQRSGGFRGTALKPIWVERRLTELFGPCGIGWGTDEPEFRVIEAAGEVLVYCTVKGWYIDPSLPPDDVMSDRRYVYGIGGDKIVTITKNGPKADDEAFKKAATDAIGNAFKHVGVGADIHMGQFDDSKYVQAVDREFRAEEAEERKANEPAARQKLEGPCTSASTLKAALKQFVRSLEGCGQLADLDDLLADEETAAVLKQCERDLPDWWKGGPSVDHLDNFVPLSNRIDQRRWDLEQLAQMDAGNTRTVLDAG